MRLQGKMGLAAGVLIGALAATLTFTVERIIFVASNALLRWLQAAAFTLITPGVILEYATGRSFHGLPVWLTASCNFLFWLGFAWLFGFLLGKLRQQIRLLASHF